MTTQPLSVTWGVAQVAYPGLPEAGDSYLVERFRQGVLLAVIDGLGHGPKATEPAQAAVKALKRDPRSDPATLMQRCHKALRGTRGAVVSIASVDAAKKTMTWLGVGNVTGILLHGEDAATRPREHLYLSGGVVGYHLPSLRPFTVSLATGDMLILATDGIRSGFNEDIPLAMPPQPMADYILEHYNRHTDDALVLVARFSFAQ